MATRRKQTTWQEETGLHEITPEEALAAAAEQEIEETPTDRVATLLSLASGDDRAYIACYRLNKGKMEWCKRYQPGEFEDGSFDMIRDDFGPGEYELRLYGPHHSTNKWSVLKRTRIEMADIPKRPDQAALPNGMNQVLSTIAQGQQQMLEALVAMKQAPQKDPMEEMTRMLSLMSMMREAMGLNQAQPASSRSSIGEIVDAIKELRAAASEVVPEKDESDGLMGMLPKVLELVQAGQQQQALQAPHDMAMQPMHQVDQAGVLSSVTLPPAFATQQQESEEVNPLKLIKLRGYLKTLVDHAEKNTPVEECATFVYEKLPDDLIDLMELPTWFDLLAAVAPEVKAHQAYLTEVRNKAMGMFSEDETGN